MIKLAVLRGLFKRIATVRFQLDSSPASIRAPWRVPNRTSRLCGSLSQWLPRTPRSLQSRRLNVKDQNARLDVIQIAQIMQLDLSQYTLIAAMLLLSGYTQV